jgi:hypothetical protein
MRKRLRRIHLHTTPSLRSGDEAYARVLALRTNLEQKGTTPGYRTTAQVLRLNAMAVGSDGNRREVVHTARSDSLRDDAERLRRPPRLDYSFRPGQLRSSHMKPTDGRIREH